VKYTTLRFGDIEVAEDQMITFAHGLPAFEELRQFTIIHEGEGVPFSHLQSLENGDLAFILTSPFLFHSQYELQMPDAVIDELGIISEQDVMVWGIVTVAEQLHDATINLLAPIIINNVTKQGKQIILHDTSYTTKHRLIPAEARTEGDEHARTQP
jgi:flagellar assembly factor FliW